MEDNKELIAQISEKLVEDTVARVMDKIPARKAVATDAVVEMKTVMAEGLKKLENREVKALTHWHQWKRIRIGPHRSRQRNRARSRIDWFG
jgi:hypothetical protein